MAYRIAICDDEEKQIQILSALLAKWAGLSRHACDIRTFTSGEEFLFEYEQDKAYDILLLDVEMQDISGLDLARRIRRDGSPSEIIFVTSHFEFIGEGYEVDALHYLVKPVSEEKLMSVLSRAADRLAAQPPSLVITCGGETVKLRERDILYVESFLHYISIHTEEKEYKIKENISSFGDRLSDDFFRIHRSYLASLKHITKISRTSVSIEGKINLPLARGKYDAVNRAFVEHN